MSYTGISNQKDITIEKIFSHFENSLNKEGLISRSEYWDFVDWVPKWWPGIPNVKAEESLTIV